jgi:hypothetical protein
LLRIFTNRKKKHRLRRKRKRNQKADYNTGPHAATNKGNRTLKIRGKREEGRSLSLVA